MVYLKIEKVKLQHIRCFDRIEVSFSKGVNVISGSNGSGKSTILTSIGYGLFGSSYLYGMSLDTDDLIQRGYSKGKIWLTFQTNQGRYTSVQTIREGKNNIWNVWKEGIAQPLTETISESRDVIQQLLGGEIDHTIFKNALCSRQGELTALIDETPGTRRDQIRKILGLERFITASHHLNKFQKSLDTRMKGAEEKIVLLEETTKDPEMLEEKLQHLEAEEDNLTKEIERLVKANESLKNSIAEMRQLKNKISHKSTSVTELQKTLEVLGQEITNADTQKQEFEQKYDQHPLTPEAVKGLLERFSEDLEEVNQQFQAKSGEISQYDKTEKELHSLSQKLQKTEEAIQRLQQRENKLVGNRSVKELEQERNDLKEFASEAEEKIAQLHEQIATTERLQNEYSTSKQELQQEVNRLIKEFEKSFISAPSAAEKIKTELETKQETISSGLSRLKQFRHDSQQKFSDIRARHQLLTKTVKLLEDQTITHDCPVCLRTFEENSTKKLRDHHSSELSKLDKEKNKLETKIKKQTKSIETLEAKQDEVQAKLIKMDHLLPEIDTLPEKKKRITQLETHLTQVQEQLKTHRERYRELQQKKRENIDQELADLAKKIADLKEITESQKTKELEREKFQEDLKKLEEELHDVDIEALRQHKLEISVRQKKIQDEISFLNTQVMGVVQKHKSKTEEKKDKEERLEELKEHLEQLQGQFEEEEFNLKKEKAEHLSQKLGSLKQKQSTLVEEQIPQIKEQILENQQHHQKIEQYREDLERFVRITPRARTIEDILEKTPDILIQQKSTALSNYLTNMLRRMLPDREFSKVVFQSDGDLLLYNKKRIIDKSTLSGGERTVLALAMRLALADYVAPLKFLILDEPTNHLDAQRIAEFIEIIDREQIFSDADGQLLLVTHREEFDRNAEQSIQLVVNDGKRKVIQ